MLVRDRWLFKTCAERFHQVSERREAGRDHGRIVDRNGSIARQAEGQKSHRHAVVEMRRNCSSAFDRPGPLYSKRFAFNLVRDPIDLEAGCRGREAVAFLGFEFSEAFHPRIATCKCRDNGKHGVLIDHARSGRFGWNSNAGEV